MKRKWLVCIGVLSVAMACMVVSVSAEEARVEVNDLIEDQFLGVSELYEYRWFDKLMRGGINIITSPVEIVKAIDLRSRKYGMFKGSCLGTYYGVANIAVRAWYGAVEVATCPFRYPDSFMDPVYEPIRAWDEWEMWTV